jgi:proteasome lid subunit RPN8/RPN11
MALADVRGLRLWISPGALAAATAAAAAGYPEEVCGFLSGPARPAELVDLCHPVPNAQAELHARAARRFPGTPRTAYAMAPRDLIPLLAPGGPWLKVLYHSHPDGEPRPSTRDLAAGTLGAYPLQQLILAVRDGVVTGVCLVDPGGRVRPAGSR